MAYSGSSESTPQRHTTSGQSGPVGKSQDSAAIQSPGDSRARLSEEGYERLVFTDPVAFRCLEEDSTTVLVGRRGTLVGYEIYIVEQWACSRVHPTFVINTYTGDPSHIAIAGVLKVPKDERLWSSRLKVYFDTITQCHARRRETPLGTLMVTNLSSLPSTLTVIDVPEGDVRKYREYFVLNEDLKRLGCSGRAGLNLKQPTPATEAKFYQLYRTSERVPLFAAVIGLIKLCQMALSVFDKMAAEYIDGLLCDVTERAINDWWADIGTELFNIEPTDGLLGPTTVSALLGTFIGARNRLHAWGAPVAKDAFDLENLKRGIGSFQKAQKLEKTRRLDRQTLDKLHRATAKAASGEGWTVPRAVKSTVAELGGKGGEMVMGMVGGRDKAGISEVETLDMDRFVQLVTGEKAKWLWHGKSQKSHSDPFRHDAGEDEMAFSKDSWSSRRKDIGSGFSSGRPSLETEQSWKHTETPTTVDSREQQLKHALKKSVSVKVSDARAGLGRFRDAVGLPGLRSHHQHKQSKESIDVDIDLPFQRMADPAAVRSITKSKPESNKSMGNEMAIFGTPSADRENSEPLSNPLSHIPTSDLERAPTDFQNQLPQLNEKAQGQLQSDEPSVEPKALQRGMSDKSSRELDQVDGPIMVTRVLRRPLSLSAIPMGHTAPRKNICTFRHLSFSTVEESMLSWKGVGALKPTDFKSDANLATSMFYEEMMTEDVRALNTSIADLDLNTSVWVEYQVSELENIERMAQARLKELDSVYQNKYAEHQLLQVRSTNLISKENDNLAERTKKLEILGAKLDYELNSLQSRVEEVENGLVDYEHHIKGLESRVRQVVKDEKKSGTSWVQWGRQLLSRGA
ncbi:hypothetical protein PRK78_003773 [Emydomyces testavorans]|uniref:STB6-like N-terminal domain-containing protein n=1 Tax=Emydomyces testavorans TaxID=2070801 RepID=A0AAF0DGU7_9EURO|nr:hypothetical protein PRK78_003773 [Emydomyces testavorans]